MRKLRFLLLLPALAVISLALISTRFPVPQGSTATPSRPEQALGDARTAGAAHVAASYGRLPLSFEANQGQTDGRVKFLSRGRGYALFLTGNEAVLSLRSQKSSVRSQNQETRPWSVVNRQLGRATDHGLGTADAALSSLLSTPNSLLPGFDPQLPTPDSLLPPAEASSVVRLQLVGASTRAQVVGLDELPGKSNYFIGNDPKKWRTNVATYAKVKYRGVYPGVDLVYYGHEGQMEYDFVVAPGADPSAIRLAINSGNSKPEIRNSKQETGNWKIEKGSSELEDKPVRIDANGDLVIAAEAGEVRFHKPVVYQEQLTVGPGQSKGKESEARSQKKSKVQRTTDDGPQTITIRQSGIVNCWTGSTFC